MFPRTLREVNSRVGFAILYNQRVTWFLYIVIETKKGMRGGSRKWLSNSLSVYYLEVWRLHSPHTWGLKDDLTYFHTNNNTVTLPTHVGGG